MARISGLGGPQLDTLIAGVELLALRALRAVIRAAVRVLGADDTPTVEDVAVIPVAWAAQVEASLLPAVEEVWAASASAASTAFADAGLTGPDGDPNAAARYMTAARNRLVGIGDDLWAEIRDQLVEGMTAGEGVQELAARIGQVSGAGEPRAMRIARTEVIAASNAASLATARLLGRGVTKEWLATPDSRTRPSHQLADGQLTPVGEPFEVGDANLMYPGDPTGPADECVNCRCSLAFSFGDPMDPLTAAAEVQTGAMIALVPSEADAARLAVEGGEPAEQLHVTLFYLGQADSFSPEQREHLVSLVTEQVTALGGPVNGDAFAVDVFNPGNDDHDTAIVLGVGGDALPQVHDAVVAAVDGYGVELPEQHSPWVPHLTLVYSDDLSLVEQLVDRTGPIVFDRVRVAFGGKNTDIPFGGPTSADEDQDEVGKFAEADVNAPSGDHNLRDYWVRGEGAAHIRWPEPGSFGRCVAALAEHVRDPEGLCAEYHHEATGKWPGAKNHHGADVNEVLDTATIEPTPDVVAPPQPVVELGFQSGEHWHALGNIEGISTGMRRFTENALTWRDLPFAFHWQFQSAAHGGMPVTAHVGLVTRVIRDGPTIHMWGTLDLGSERGSEYGRRLAAGFERWVSIGLDESFKEADIEYVWPDGFDAETDIEFGEPEEMLISRGRIGELTGVSVPAQQEATIEPAPELIEQFALTAAVHDETEHPRGLGGKWVRKESGAPGVTTSVPTSGGDVAVDADDDGLIGVGVGSQAAGRVATARIGPEAAAELTAAMRAGLEDGTDVTVEDGDDQINLSREGDDYQIDVGRDSVAVSGDDLQAVADTIDEAAASTAADTLAPDVNVDESVLQQATAADIELSLYDDGSIDLSWSDGGFNVEADEVILLADTFEDLLEAADDETTEWPQTTQVGELAVTADEAGDVEIRWGDGANEAAAFTLDEIAELGPVLRDLGANYEEGIMVASATGAGGRRVMASRTVPRRPRPTVIVAAGHTITIPSVPPPEWFAEPTDVDSLGALTVTDEGRVYGWLAPAGIAHRAFQGRRQEVPMGRVDYNRWMGGEAIVAGGRVVAGPITMGCGHMSPTASADSTVRMEHYDNTCSVVAHAAIGETRKGVWIAGALLPGVTADQVTRMLACRLSGDWAPHPERPGWREFVAALLVPVPGFPMARSGPSVRIADEALVAAAVPVRLAGPDLVADSEVGAEPTVADLRPVFERVARGIGRDHASRMALLHSRVRARN